MNNFYQATAAKYIEIDETDNGELFCTIPSEKDMDTRYSLKCKESSAGVEVLSCDCPSRKNGCKHVAIAQKFWDGIYSSNVAKAQAKQQAEESTELVDLPAELQGSGKTLTVPQGNGSEMLRTTRLNAQSNWASLLPSRQKIA